MSHCRRNEEIHCELDRLLALTLDLELELELHYHAANASSMDETLCAINVLKMNVHVHPCLAHRVYALKHLQEKSRR